MILIASVGLSKTKKQGWKIIERYELRNVPKLKRIEINITYSSNTTDENESLLL